MLQVYNDQRLPFLVMSERAYNSLSTSQINQIEAHTEIIVVPIYFIEEVGGGSARCMMAEIFLPKSHLVRGYIIYKKGTNLEFVGFLKTKTA